MGVFKMKYCVLIIFCMFVGSKRFERNLETNFFYDKELLIKGNKSERLVLPLLDNVWTTLRWATPHTKTFSMSKENNFVTVNTVRVNVTPAQQKLLQLITPVEAEDFFKSLKSVHHLATYCVDNDMADLQSSNYTHLILDAIQEIATENFISNLLKTA